MKGSKNLGLYYSYKYVLDASFIFNIKAYYNKNDPRFKFIWDGFDSLLNNGEICTPKRVINEICQGNDFLNSPYYLNKFKKHSTDYVSDPSLLIESKNIVNSLSDDLKRRFISLDASGEADVEVVIVAKHYVSEVWTDDSRDIVPMCKALNIKFRHSKDFQSLDVFHKK